MTNFAFHYSNKLARALFKETKLNLKEIIFLTSGTFDMIRGCPIQQTASTSETQVTLFLKLKGVKSLELSLQT